MNADSMAGLEVQYVELCDGDMLRGYAIFFSGGWDAYINNFRGGLESVGSNYLDMSGALKAVRMGCDWRTTNPWGVK